MRSRPAAASSRSSCPTARTTGTSCCATRSGWWRAATAPSCARGRACCSTRRRCARPAGCTGCSPRCSPSATPRSTGCSRRRATPTTSCAPVGCASWSRPAPAGSSSRCRPSSRWGSATAAGSTASEERTVTVRAAASGDDPAMQWRITVDGAPCRFLVFGTWSSASASSSMPGASRSTRTIGGSPSAPTRRRCGASATPMRPTIWSPARRVPSRRSAGTSCSTSTASRAAARMWR